MSSRLHSWLILFFLCFVTGCGGGGVFSGVTVPSVGYVVDPPVGGMAYTCGALSGATGSDGSFHYNAGTACSFTVGKVTVGIISAVPSDGIVTPHDLAGVSRSDAFNTNAVAIAQFLQSLDDRTQLSGISIPASVVSALGNVAPTRIASSELTSAQIQTQLSDLIATATNGKNLLVSAEVAGATLNTYLQAAYPNLNPFAGVTPPTANGSSANTPNLAATFPASLTASNTSVGFSATSDVDANGYWEILPATAVSPNQWQIMSGLDANNVAATLSGNSRMTAATTTLFETTRLAYNTSYKLYFVAANANASGKVTQVFSSSIITGAAPQPPILTTSVSSPITSSTGSVAIPLTSDVTGTGYWVVLSAGAAPTAAQVVAGTDSLNTIAQIKGSTQMVGGSAVNINVSGLAYSTNYTMYFAATNLADATKISQLWSVSIQTGPSPPPKVTAISTRVTPSGTAVAFSVTVDSGATGYWVALDSSATSPSAAQVMAGTDAAGSAVAISGNQALAAASATSISVSKLAYSTAYTIYFVAATSPSGASATGVQAIGVDTTTAPPVEVGSITLKSDLVLKIGEKAAIQIEVRDLAGNVLPITAGSAQFAIVSGADRLKITDGMAEALAGGDVVVTASLQGIVSPQTTVHVIPRRYIATDMGSLGGGTIRAAAINNKGQVTGTATLPSGETRAFIWTPNRDNGVTGNIADLGIPSGFATARGVDINDVGQIVGNAYPASGYSNQAFIWQSGTMKVVSGSPSAASYSYAVGINSKGQVLLLSGNPFIWYQDTFTLISGISPTAWAPAGINDAGTVVGYYTIGHGAGTQIAWIFPGLSTLGYWNPVAINASGQIIGNMSGTGVLWSNGSGTTLAGLDPQPSSFVTRGINNRSQIVGTFKSQRGVIWEGGVAYDLNTMLPPGSRWSIDDATDINDQGQIISGSLLLTPEP